MITCAVRGMASSSKCCRNQVLVRSPRNMLREARGIVGATELVASIIPHPFFSFLCVKRKKKKNSPILPTTSGSRCLPSTFFDECWGGDTSKDANGQKFLHFRKECYWHHCLCSQSSFKTRKIKKGRYAASPKPTVLPNIIQFWCYSVITVGPSVTTVDYQ